MSSFWALSSKAILMVYTYPGCCTQGLRTSLSNEKVASALLSVADDRQFYLTTSSAYPTSLLSCYFLGHAECWFTQMRRDLKMINRSPKSLLHIFNNTCDRLVSTCWRFANNFCPTPAVHYSPVCLHPNPIRKRDDTVELVFLVF